ncbi:unnamed protein product [Bemisia tabaci]|uniref:Uncharacterized protein n=1 Tax=Bemisia tabaci TaxID=7038 RepID=A0A9P0A1Y2_BEMTA|nr:unnamed protein product [Bemisia tabaci]
MFLAVGVLWTLALASAQQLNLVHEWNLVNYNTPRGYPGQEFFLANRTIITSTEVGFDRQFFAIPKIWSDNPATLVSIPKNSAEKGPIFEAYPSWDWHVQGVKGQPKTPTTCSGFVNVFRLRVDRCGRLWALDCGILDSYVAPDPICPPKLIAFDLHTHREVKRIEIPKSVLLANSLLSNFQVDDTDEFGNTPEGNCDVGHIYISDIAAPAVIVYNVKTTEIWRHFDPAFYPHPDHGKFTVAGDSFVLMDGIIGTALSNPGPQRDFFWHPMSSNSIFAVSTAALKVPPAASDPDPLPVRKLGEKSSQSIPLAYDPVTEALVFSPATECALVSWKLGEKNYRLLAYDPVTLQWISEIRPAILDDNHIWVVSSRLQKYEHNTVNPNEVNQRLFRLERAQHPRNLGFSPVSPDVPLLHPEPFAAAVPDYPLQNHLVPIPLRLVRETQEERETPLGLARFA